MKFYSWLALALTSALAAPQARSISVSISQMASDENYENLFPETNFSLGSADVETNEPRPSPKEELPLILNEESEAISLPSGRPRYSSEYMRYHRVVICGAGGLILKKIKDYEPVGLHVDQDPFNINTTRRLSGLPGSVAPAEGGVSSGISPDGSSLDWPAIALAHFSGRNILMSARLEKRRCPTFGIRGDKQEITQKLIKLFIKEGITVSTLGRDFFLLTETPGQEKPFPYTDRARAKQYELDREAWLLEHEDYVTQGLIYQPTGDYPDFPSKDIRVRHAAAALAKLSGKEVFVQPTVEKREFKPTKRSTSRDTREIQAEQITRQLDKAYVQVVELNPNCLALVTK